jgi:excisionase family DNA binding protein
MSAYATQKRVSEDRALRITPTSARGSGGGVEPSATIPGAQLEVSLIDQLVDRLAERVAPSIAAQLSVGRTDHEEWFDSRHAAEYLGVHRDTLRKLAAERAILSEQDGPGCKLYFKRSDLDEWRQSGGRPRHLASLASVA